MDQSKKKLFKRRKDFIGNIVISNRDFCSVKLAEMSPLLAVSLEKRPIKIKTLEQGLMDAEIKGSYLKTKSRGR